MKLFTCCLMLLLCVVSGTHADTYTLPLDDCLGDYEAFDSYGRTINFGLSFADIQSAKISWSGRMQSGLDEDSLPLRGRFVADFTEFGIQATAYSAWSEWSYYSQPFAQQSSFYTSGTWDFLLDGRCSLWISFEPESLYESPPVGQLSTAILIIEATLVPEPSGLLLLMCGLGSLGVVIRRMRR